MMVKIDEKTIIDTRLLDLMDPTVKYYFEKVGLEKVNVKYV